MPAALANSRPAPRQGRTAAGGRLVEGRVLGRVVVVSATRLAPCPPVLFTTLPQSYGAELSPFGATSKRNGRSQRRITRNPTLDTNKARQKGQKEGATLLARHALEPTRVLGLRLRLKPAGTRFRPRGPHFAGRRHRRPSRPFRLLVVVCPDDLFSPHQRVHLLAADGLVLHQGLGDCLQLVAIDAQDFAGLAFAFRDDAADLFIDQLSGVLGHVLALRDGVTQKHLLLVLVVPQGTEPIAHAPFGHHAAGEFG